MPSLTGAFGSRVVSDNLQVFRPKPENVLLRNERTRLLTRNSNRLATFKTPKPMAAALALAWVKASGVGEVSAERAFRWP